MDRSWISQRKDSGSKGTNEINLLLEKAAKRRKIYEENSWQWDKSEELVDEDSTVDGVFPRVAAEISPKKVSNANNTKQQASFESYT